MSLPSVRDENSSPAGDSLQRHALSKVRGCHDKGLGGDQPILTDSQSYNGERQ